MKTLTLGTSGIRTSRLAYGCWRLAGSWNPAEVSANSIEQGKKAVITAFEAGYTLFDHADIYCDGHAESIFGQVLKDVPAMRKQVIIASKCGIRKPGEPAADSPYRYDFSREYIIGSCEQSLKRLGIETLDIYQLHRPDYLCDPEEVASAFEQLKRQGKVQCFGVSNFKPTQVNMLQSACPVPLIVNQVEISLACLRCFEDGTLDQCLEKKIIPLAWSPLGGGLLGNGARNLLPSQQVYRPEPINAALDKLAAAKGTSRTVLALAWLMKHPSKIIPIVGSTNPDRIKEAAKAADLDLTHEEWYQLFGAARSERLP